MKESKGEEDGNGNKKVTQRRVVLYFYVKENPFTSDNITMVRVSAHAPLNGSYNGVLNVTKEFMGDTIPCMFEIREEENPCSFYPPRFPRGQSGDWVAISRSFGDYILSSD